MFFLNRRMHLKNLLHGMLPVKGAIVVNHSNLPHDTTHSTNTTRWCSQNTDLAWIMHIAVSGFYYSSRSHGTVVKGAIIVKHVTSWQRKWPLYTG